MYTITQKSYCIVSSSAASLHWLLNDAPKAKAKAKETQKILEAYITDACAVFLKKTKALSDFKKNFTRADEKHLSSMLELLIEARRVWEDEA